MGQNSREFMQKAGKAVLVASWGFGLLGSCEEKYQEAANLYSDAANAFKEDGKEFEAGEVYAKAADILTNKLKKPDDAANMLVDAFKAYCHTDPSAAIKCIDIAIERFLGQGNLLRAARHTELKAMLLEKLDDNLGAFETYCKAASYFESDGTVVHAIRLWTKMADLAMSDKAYATAAGLYVQAAKATLGNSTLRYTAKNHALKAAICHIADNEPAAARQVLENHSKVDRVFAERLEKTMLMKLAWTLTNRNTIGYETCLLRCRQERILSRFHLQILVEVKQAIVPDEEELVFA